MTARGGANDPVEAEAAGDTTVVLDASTLWRHFRVAEASHIRRADGSLVRARINWAHHVRYDGWDPANASPPPPADWAGLAFDDGAWPRDRLPQPAFPAVNVSNQSGNTGSLNFYDTVVVLTRAKFEVKDLAKVKSCRLSLDYWGGVVVYVNGREAVRVDVPVGQSNLVDTVARDYPEEAFLTPAGRPLKTDDDKNQDRLALRDRRLRDFEIPAALLRPGVNVVALELHPAPIPINALKTRVFGADWPPIGLLSASLTVSPNAAIAPRPRGIHVWNCAAYDTVTAFDYGDTSQPLRPIVIRAARNSVFSGRLMVSSDSPIKGLKVEVSDLTLDRGSAKIPSAAVRVRYAVAATEGKSWVAPHRFDGLLDALPLEIPVNRASLPGENFYSLRVKRRALVAGAVAPLWFTVRVPRDAKPGVYEGKVTVVAAGLPATTVPLRVNVCAWSMPDPKDFRIQNFLYHAEEVTARHYGVPNYSDKHFELVGKSLAVLAEANSRQIHANLTINFCGRGNPESLVRWIEQPDGTYKHDFTNFDKYLDMVAKSVGTPCTLRLHCWSDGGGQVSVFDPATGKLGGMPQPQPGTEESYAFWKPVFDEILKKLKTRGWLNETTLAYNNHSGVPPPAMVDIAHRLWPAGEWSWTSHAASEGAKFVGTFEGVGAQGGFGSRAARIAIGAESVDSDKAVLMTVRHSDGVWMLRPSGKLPPLWALDRPRRNTYCNTVRHVINDNSALREVRRLVEHGALYAGYDGVSEFGADLFPLKKPVGGYAVPPISFGANWGNRNSNLALLYPGPEGPLATERFEMFREGVELCEAILFVRNALHNKRLSGDLQKRAERYLGPGTGERERTFARGFFMPRYMQAEEDAKLLELAGEVAVLWAAIETDCTAGEMPLPVRFDGRQSTSASNTIVSYAWDFGDGTTAQGAEAAHIYEKAGEFKAGLTVKDGEGRTNVARATILVRPVDDVAPALLNAAAHRADRVVTTFSEPVRQEDAERVSNYVIAPGITVNSASLAWDGRTVTLEIAPLSLWDEYSLTVNNIRDIARNANAVPPGSRKTFRYAGLFAWWKLADRTGMVAADASGSLALGRLQGKPAWTKADGRQALSFRGADDCIEASAPMEALRLPFTISLWVKPAVQESAQLFANKQGQPLRVLFTVDPASQMLDLDAVELREDYFGVVIGEDGGTDIMLGLGAREVDEDAGPKSVQLDAGRWQHVAVVCESGGSVCYVNGSEKSRSPVKSGLVGEPDASFPLVKRFRIGRLFHGLVSDVRIYRVALSPAKVQAVMKDGAAAPEVLTER